MTVSDPVTLTDDEREVLIDWHYKQMTVARAGIQHDRLHQHLHCERMGELVRGRSQQQAVRMERERFGKAMG